jgi:hypothetical protein
MPALPGLLKAVRTLGYGAVYPKMSVGRSSGGLLEIVLA